MATKTAQKHPQAPGKIAGDFALAVVGTRPGCSFCGGLTKIGVFSRDQQLIGFLYSDWPWTSGITDDMEDHPNEPHYEVDWIAEDADGNRLPDDVSDLYFTATRMYENWKRS